MTPFPFVHVNLDGSARELSPEERRYLSQEYHGADGGRPYIKPSYEAVDGWGSASGFLRRELLPDHVDVLPVHPEYDARVAADPIDPIELERAAGSEITYNENGSITAARDPQSEPAVAYERAKQAHLDMVRARERMARAGDSAT